MPLIVVPAGVGAGLGEGGAGATGEELPGAVGPEFDAVAGAGTAIALLAGVEVVPPHPAITIRIVPAKAILNAKRGTERISQF